jgi:hypothetical protein
MLKIFLMFFSLFILINNNAYAEWKSHKTENYEYWYRIIALDGSQHILNINYQQTMNKNIWQSGSAARLDPFDFHPRDSRNCHMEHNFEIRKNYTGSFKLHQSGQPSTQTSEISINPSRKLYYTHVNDGGNINSSNYFERLSNGTLLDMYAKLDESIDGFSGNSSSDIPLLEHVYDTLNLNSLQSFGNMVGRVLGLRTGVNCREAQPLIDATLKTSEALYFAEAELLRVVDYYLYIFELLQNWKYLSENGKWIPAVFIYPHGGNSNFDSIFQNQNLLLMSKILSRKTSLEEYNELIDEQFQYPPNHIHLIAKSMEVAIGELEQNFTNTKSKIQEHISNMVDYSSINCIFSPGNRKLSVCDSPDSNTQEDCYTCTSECIKYSSSLYLYNRSMKDQAKANIAVQSSAIYLDKLLPRVYHLEQFLPFIENDTHFKDVITQIKNIKAFLEDAYRKTSFYATKIKKYKDGQQRCKTKSLSNHMFSPALINISKEPRRIPNFRRFEGGIF